MNNKIEKLPFWNKLKNKEKEIISENSSVLSFNKGALLKGQGAACFGFFYILKGSVHAVMYSEEGREINLFRLSAGDCCVLSASCLLSQISYNTEMIASENVQILLINLGEYESLIESNVDVRCFTYELATQRSADIIWVLQQVLFSKIDQRLAAFLLSKCEQTKSNEITMSKEAIAREINTAREVVSRMLKQFAESGLITMDHKIIHLCNKSGLEKLL